MRVVPAWPYRHSSLSAGIVALALLIASCFTARDPLYCDEQTPCESAARPICDLQGAIAGGLGNTCVANDFGECQNDVDCTNSVAPICAGGQCWPCTVDSTVGADACEMRGGGTAVCKATGECVECEASSDCGAELPICDVANNTCVACDATEADTAACVAKDESAPMCSTSGVLAGQCVECTPATEAQDCTDPTKPVCGDDGRCGACGDHDDCAAGICDRDSGACVEEANIIYVDGDGLPGPACGATAGPGACEDVGDALAQVGVPPARVWIRLSEGIHDATDTNAVAIENGARVRFVGETAGTTRLAGNDQAAVVSIGSGSFVTLDRVEVRGGIDGISCVAAGTQSTLIVTRAVVGEADEDGVEATNCDVTIEETIVRNNNGLGIDLSDSTLSLQRSRVSSNLGGGINLDATGFSIRNNIINGNGNTAGTPSLIGGIKIFGSGAGDRVFEFNTVARNAKGDTGTAAGVDCETVTNIPVSSNIVWGNLKATSMTDVQVGGTCDWSYSTIQGDAPGSEIETSDPMFVNADGEDFHLQAASPCEGKANPDATLAIDYDGDVRPQGSGRDQGADEISP